MSDYLDTVELQTGYTPTASIIWMHGLGASGHDFLSIVGELDLHSCPHIRFVFPNAPQIPVTLNGGYIMPAWYDIAAAGTDINKREDENGLRHSQVQIEALIAREIERGVAADKIVIAGFSQGCAMTLQVGLRHPQKLAGLMCLSGYVPLADKVADERHVANQHTPIFMVHGTADPVIPIQRAEQSRDLLKQLGYQIEWHDYWMQHSVSPQEVIDIGHWLRKVLN
ncbi:dienelactone hydrolase family protein [Undibacterium sp. LX40W]|uniref:Dienelactone hydrolase family protein n=1 Tax=Undibacterium nitidum TaxID=2762298 RepID=A0A923HQ95_9BURK|nr:MULTISPECIES: dienelactone hydrolase family protein [Undibacterium]MBC3880492.1 dienelactone hydrolase family protein [Undibacterium nitidum]MBC3890772.1 dienelactone hydrolase family protein [Undibacterium sp. LX40W]